MSTPDPETVRPQRPDRPRHRRLARPGPADRRGAGRGRREDHAHLAQGGRPGRGRRAPAGQGHRRALGRRRREPAGRDRARGRRGDAAPGRHRHPRQQRRRHLGRAGRGLPARGLGQGDEPEHPQHLPDEPGGRQAQHDPAQARAASSTSRRSPACRGSADMQVHRLRHQQGRGGQLHAHAGRRVGPLRHHRQRARAGLLPEQDDQGHARAHRRRQAGRAPRRCAASATTTT